jgi:hypothetical protein
VSTQIKLLFDECLGKPMIEALKHLVPGDPILMHLCDGFAAGTYDNVWIPKIAQEGWIVVSSDRGRKRTKGGKLPEVCKEFKVSHILFSTSLHKRSSRDKVAALTLVWNQIQEIPNKPPGSRFDLQFRESKLHPGLTVSLVAVSE